MNEVNAAIGQLAKAVLSSDHLSQIRERWPEIAQCFQSQKGSETARGTLENGDGVGEPLIRSYLGDGGDPDNCPRSGHQIRDGLAALKSAGLYTKVITEVRDRIAAEAVEQERQAEEAEREAERTKTAAKSAAEKKKADAAADSAKKKKKSAGKASEARDRANRTSETTTKRQPQTYDPRCVNEFANAEQERAFREAVTTAAARRFIAVDLTIAAGQAHDQGVARPRRISRTAVRHHDPDVRLQSHSRCDPRPEADRRAGAAGAVASAISGDVWRAL